MRPMLSLTAVSRPPEYFPFNRGLVSLYDRNFGNLASKLKGTSKGKIMGPYMYFMHLLAIRVELYYFQSQLITCSGDFY
jgi:hypothetical protein